MSYFRFLLVICFFVQSFAFATRTPAHMDLSFFQKRFVDLRLEEERKEKGKTVILLTAKDNVTEEEVQLELTTMPAPTVLLASLKPMRKIFLARVEKAQTEGREVFYLEGPSKRGRAEEFFYSLTAVQKLTKIRAYPVLVLRPSKGGGAKEGPAPAASVGGGSKARIAKSTLANFPKIARGLPPTPDNQALMRRRSQRVTRLAPSLYYVAKRKIGSSHYINIYPCLYLGKKEAMDPVQRKQIESTLYWQIKPEIDKADQWIKSNKAHLVKLGMKRKESLQKEVSRFWNEVESNEPTCLPLGKFNATITIKPGYSSVSLDYLYAFSLPSYGGTKMVCFFLEYVKRAFNLNLGKLEIELMAADGSSWKSYERMGFEKSQYDGANQYFKSNMAKLKKTCDAVFTGEKRPMIYHEDIR